MDTSFSPIDIRLGHNQVQKSISFLVQNEVAVNLMQC